MTDFDFMRRAIELAKKGEGWVNPNPLVGAVIVKDGQIVGEGFHHRCGELHAERDALRDCTDKHNNASGATIYVTLEPCCHFGKQPPCTQALVDAGIKKVVVGSRDPNPLVCGKGNSFLRSNGIEVVEDFLKDECDGLNAVFFKYITTDMPYVALKYAMTGDGKIATASGDSKWISCEESRRFVHVLRNRYSAILAGIGTVLADDPLLNCRSEVVCSGDEKKSSVEIYGVRNPVRIICDTELKLPLESRIVESSGEYKTIVACGKSFFESNQQAALKLEEKNIQVLPVDELELDGKMVVDFRSLMKRLGELKIDSVLVEGGGNINFSAMESGCVDHIYSFVAPKFFGGRGKSPVEGPGVHSVDEAFKFSVEGVRQLGDDLLIEYKAK